MEFFWPVKCNVPQWNGVVPKENKQVYLGKVINYCLNGFQILLSI